MAAYNSKGLPGTGWTPGAASSSSRTATTGVKVPDPEKQGHSVDVPRSM